jgi:hypothetical protein
MHCDICKRQLANGEAVYRFWGVPFGFWPFARNKSVITACTRCRANPPQKRSSEGSVYTFQRFEHAYPPQPCQHCGRPVYADRQRRGLRYFVCSDQCRIAIYNANARAKLKQGREHLRCPSSRVSSVVSYSRRSAATPSIAQLLASNVAIAASKRSMQRKRHDPATCSPRQRVENVHTD